MTRLARLTALQSYVIYIYRTDGSRIFVELCKKSQSISIGITVGKAVGTPIWWQERCFFAQLRGRIRSQSRTFIGKNSQSISIGITVGYADGLACLVTRNVFFFAQRRGRLRSRSRTSCHTSSSAEVCPSRFFIVGSLTIVWWWVTFFLHMELTYLL